MPVQPWALQDRIPLRHVTLFSGHGATGKSLMQLQLSVAAVLGKQWLDTAPLPGPVMFVDAEDDENVIHKRLADILCYYNADFDQLNDLHVYPLVGSDAVLAEVNGKSGRVTPTKLYRTLFEKAADIKPSIIGLASSADMFAGNEIDRGQVRQFHRPPDRRGHGRQQRGGADRPPQLDWAAN